jgi:hypothetical protein
VELGATIKLAFYLTSRGNRGKIGDARGKLTFLKDGAA